MKKCLCVVFIAITCISMLFVGCVQNTGGRPDSFKQIKWTSSDYSFRFTPQDDCKGTFKYKEKKYNIKLVFSLSSVIFYDIDKNNVQLFDADWKYEDKEKLYLYNVSFNTEAYKEMKDILLEFIMLHKEKIS